jgi:hypothetical protein
MALAWPALADVAAPPVHRAGRIGSAPLLARFDLRAFLNRNFALSFFTFMLDIGMYGTTAYWM